MTDEQRPDITPILRGERVYLRGHERSDIATFVRWFNDSELTAYLSMREPMSMPMEEAWFERMVEAHGKDRYHFTICRLADSQPIGTCGLFGVDLVNGNAGIGISIGEKSLWNQGFGTDAMKALLDFGFGMLRLERLWLEVYDFNNRARRSYEKVGFVLEGTQRRAIYKRGRFTDVHLMAMLRSEWEQQGWTRPWDYHLEPGEPG
jgi:RimJ/RimL family protein N-acetyltransferase